MTHEAVLKREDGKQYKIIVKFSEVRFDKFGYNFYVQYREKGKRKWLQVPDDLQYWEYRKLSYEAREEARTKNYLRFVTKEEVDKVKLGCWENLKPVTN